MVSSDDEPVVAEVRWVPSVVRNVVATIKGRTPGAWPLAVMTPRSGWWHCAGERGIGWCAGSRCCGRCATRLQRRP